MHQHSLQKLEQPQQQLEQQQSLQQSEQQFDQPQQQLEYLQCTQSDFEEFKAATAYLIEKFKCLENENFQLRTVLEENQQFVKLGRENNTLLTARRGRVEEENTKLRELNCSLVAKFTARRTRIKNLEQENYLLKKEIEAAYEAEYADHMAAMGMT